jgi:hypothetical protein
LAAIFELDKRNFNLRRALPILGVALVTLVVLHALNQEKSLLSVMYGLMFLAVSDPGGDYGYRISHMALFAALGVLLTALGFGVGDQAWGWVALAAFVVTLLGGLTVRFGLHRFVSALLLNVWFIVAISLSTSYQQAHVHVNAWGQALAWLIGSALTLAYVTVIWLARGRTAPTQPFADLIPSDVKPVPLSRPVILFAVIRAVAVTLAVGIAFGLNVPNADWMPLAAIAAMKPNLAQSALAAEQRLVGATLGAIVAAVFLLTVSTKSVLEVVIIVLGALAIAIRGVNYAFYTAAVAGAVLIGIDLPHPANLGDEARRVFFTFVGVGIAVGVTFLANLLAKRTQTAQKTPPSQAARDM